jgi:hypothetical protein
VATDRNDELLNKILGRQDELIGRQDAMVAVLGEIRDRLPAPAAVDTTAPAAGEPVAVTLREPATPDAGDTPATTPTPRKTTRRKAATPLKDTP